MEDLKEKMYVRTNSSYIRKINEIRGKTLILDDEVSDEDGDYRIEISFEDIKKASFNIIDLIEIGDYVNGKEILEVMNDGKMSRVKTEDETYFNEDIKTVVTKALFNFFVYYV